MSGEKVTLSEHAAAAAAPASVDAVESHVDRQIDLASQMIQSEVCLRFGISQLDPEDVARLNDWLLRQRPGLVERRRGEAERHAARQGS